MASRKTDAPVSLIQIDGLVILKIVKHCQDESGGGTDLVQGVLLGLVVEDRLEVTNCFPFPRRTEDDDFDEVSYQMAMMRNLRHVNVDHLHVGWYQSTVYGSYLNKALLESQYSYQHSIDESIVLIYDPLKTAQGHLSLKALRLTPSMMSLYKENDFSPDNLRQAGLTFEKMFEEVPIVIKNSHLVNVLLCELQEKQQPNKQFPVLDLATSSVMEKHLKLMMTNVDELTQDANKFANFMRQAARQKQLQQQKRQMENSQRQARGEAPLTEEELNKMFHTLQPPSRLDSMLCAGQVCSYVDQVNNFAIQGLGKLFVADSFQSSLKDSKH